MRFVQRLDSDSCVATRVDLGRVHDTLVPRSASSRWQRRDEGRVQLTLQKEAGFRMNAWVVILFGFAVGFACLAYVFVQ